MVQMYHIIHSRPEQPLDFGPTTHPKSPESEHSTSPQQLPEFTQYKSLSTIITMQYKLTAPGRNSPNFNRNSKPRNHYNTPSPKTVITQKLEPCIHINMQSKGRSSCEECEGRLGEEQRSIADLEGATPIMLKDLYVREDLVYF